MDEETKILWVGTIFGVLLGVVIALWICSGASKIEEQEWKRQTVQHNCAEYVMDPATGETTWQWKEDNSENPNN